MFSVIKTKKIWFSLSAALFALSIAAVVTWGFKLGIDFTGGALIEVHMTGTRPDSSVVTTAVASATKEQPHVQPLGDKAFIIRTKFIDEPTHQQILTQLKKMSNIGELREERFETIGPTVSSELQRRAVWSIFMVLGAIVLYVAWAFRQVSHPLPSWKFGIVAVVALLHDIIIPAGVFAVLGRFAGYEVDTLFVTAMLTILGFSVHDTIVTFDRVREHLRLTPKLDFAQLVDQSVSETIGRSINTSMTVLLVLLAVYFFGGESVKQFNLVLILGVIFGTYSSIFIACPLLVVWNRLAPPAK
ncbi:MAG: protein-export membrane protein SecF [Candidatus Magasanikbacteria bacterium RIFCSPHIGHO2_01_FULL_50_8]|uniref:Protein-export membrane protein SecF n=1 Tax=Candidatus Magasanikbacteria bacterium RIFCSPHIGHO2_01_FULL_50_8 TaxID=1798674 RepID=A0A1F6LTX1_9BACT|nr:MAG: protein-export membrane protein SecF [Candidatus Magasanikbacteria bacterium RIFCSPHIGHO2_01_FULL_50_8]